MQLFINRSEAECLLDALSGTLTKSQHNVRNALINQLLDRLGKAECTSSGWTPGIVNGRVAPIRSSWPQNVTRPSRKSNSFYHKPRKKTSKASKPSPPTLSPQEILDELSL